MSWVPSRVCTHAGCSELVKLPARKCPKHQKYERVVYDTTQRDPVATQYYHSRGWKQLSQECKRRAQGLCQLCRAQGIYRAGSEADHIVPRRKGGQDALDNLQWLCRECHGAKSTAEGSRWANCG